MKAIKRELKEWEHRFVTENDRKPDKKDIAANREIAKMYKAYAKMKMESESAGAAEAEAVQQRKQDSNDTKPPSPTKIRMSKSSKAAESTPRSEKRSDVSDTKVHKIVASAETPRPVLKDIAFMSAETIMDKEDLEDQQFFNETYKSQTQFVSQPSFTSDGTVRPTSSTSFASGYTISKEDLYNSTLISNLGNEQRPWSGKNNNLPSNFKMRKSTIAAGPIATNDASYRSEFDGTRELKNDQFYGSNLSDNSYSLRTYSPSSFDPIASSAFSSSPTQQLQQNPEFQDFMNRRSLIEERHASTASLTQSDYTSTTPTRQSAFTEAKIVKPHPLGSAPSVTQIRVITPTRAMGSEPFMQSSPKAVAFKKSAAVLDLPIPPPPTVVKVDDFGSSDESIADDDEESFEDQAAVMVSSKVGNDGRQATSAATVVLEAKKARQRRPNLESKAASEDVKIRKLPDNSFFQLQGPEVEEAEVEPFHAVKPIEKPIPANVKDAKEEPKEEPKEEKDAGPDAIAVVETAVVAPVIKAVTFVSNPKAFIRIPDDGFVLKCRVTRKKNIWDKAHPTFYLYNEVDDKFVLAARKRIKSKTVSYLISTSMDDLSKDSTHYVAKLKANFQRTNFILYDARFYNKNTNNKGLKELACITYSKTVLPRELNVAIAASAVEESSEDGTKDIMADIKSANKEKLQFLKNKPPRWNETTQSHCLNFGGRVTQPSIKNFQLIGEDSDTIVLQFGRCGPDIFSLDARYPMTPVEAFAVAITTFDAYDSA
ncbi:Tub family-domain-containing protein [Chytriomyces cf. hyalinus JEL632]|nr:Tub family-domain-containing protein [Chytriomyces cf. hyalinus JEL632]